MTPAVPVKPTNPAVVAREARADKLRTISAGLTKLPSETIAPLEKPAEIKVAAKVEPVVEPEQKKEEPVVEKPVEKPVEVEAKPEDELDPKTAKGLAAIDKQAKKFREEQAAAKKAFEQEVADQRAELARMKQEFTSKAATFEELQKLVKGGRAIDALRKLGIETEEEWEMVGRGAFPHTKAGKADPRSQAVVAQTQREREIAEQLAEIKRENAELRETFTASQRKVEAMRVVEEWSSAAVKAIPSDSPTLIARLHAKSPEKARQALLAIGAELERANDNETPTHAEVIAEFEKRERAELEDRGVDVDALLKGTAAKPTPATKPTPKTLDITAPTGTRPINGSPTRAEKLAAVSAGLKKLNTADT